MCMCACVAVCASLRVGYVCECVWCVCGVVCVVVCGVVCVVCSRGVSYSLCEHAGVYVYVWWYADNRHNTHLIGFDTHEENGRLAVLQV